MSYLLNRRVFPVLLAPFLLALGLATTCRILAAPIDESLASVGSIATPTSQGTGFLVGKRNLLVTNYHVVAKADKAMVSFPDGAEIAVTGFIVASPEHDLVILELEKDASAPPLELSERHVAIGTDVYVLGAPKGLEGSVSKGVVSAYRQWKDLEPLYGPIHEFFDYSDDSRWVQTDAAINHGNSGGPILLGDGKVLAVSTLASPAGLGQNLNFGVDILHVRRLLASLSDAPQPLSRLPRRGNTDAPAPNPPGTELARTKAYWNELAGVLGTFATEVTEVNPPAAKDDKPTEPTPPARANDKPVGLDDPMFGKTPSERARRIRRWASEANLTYEEALTRDFWTLKSLKDEARDPRFANRRRDALTAKKLAEANKQENKPDLDEFNRQAMEAERKARELALRNRDICIKTIAAIEVIPINNVSPIAIDYANEVRAGLQRVGLSIDRMNRLHDTVKAFESGDNPFKDNITQAVQEIEVAITRLMELLVINGSDAQSQLRRTYGEEFCPPVHLTKEQMKTIESLQTK